MRVHRRDYDPRRIADNPNNGYIVPVKQATRHFDSYRQGKWKIFNTNLRPVFKILSFSRWQSVKQEMASAKKSELVYLDKNNTGDDVHVRNDRKLYPNSIECFNMDLQSKLNTQK